jgi:hypothetical protein
MPMPAQPGTATPSAGLARTWEAVFPGTADQLGRVRTELRPRLRDCPMADDIILLISELAANAITHHLVPRRLRLTGGIRAGGRRGSGP